MHYQPKLLYCLSICYPEIRDKFIIVKFIKYEYHNIAVKILFLLLHKQ